ncbi:MAG: WxcM-like domain-containing protein [Gaiellaceae bacterium]
MASSRLHPTAVCETHEVGDDVTIGAFAFIGRECVLDDGVNVGAGARLLDGSSAGAGARIGENSVVLACVTIGRGSVVEPASVVADAVPANAIVRGNPARIIGYRAVDVPPPSTRLRLSETNRTVASHVRGVRLQALTRVDDLRGMLIAAEFDNLPFVPVRIFTVTNVPSEHIRGSHAHHLCEQFLVSVSGGLSVVVDDGSEREELRLDNPDFGLYLPPMTWSTQYRYSPEATLLVLASRPYEPEDYIRDYDDFLRLVSADVPGLTDRSVESRDS